MGIAQSAFESTFELLKEGFVDIDECLQNIKVITLGGGGGVSSAGADIDGTVSQLYDKLNGWVGVVMTSLSGVAMALLLTFFFIGVFKQEASGQLTPEILAKDFIKVALPAGLIIVCPQMYNLIQEFGKALCDLLTQNGSVERIADAINPAEIAKKLDDSTGSVEWIGVLLSLFVGLALPTYFASLIISAVVYVISFSRIFELYVRAAFMPIGLALLGDDGWQGAGGRYIKRFVAVVCQGGVLILIGQIFSVAISSLLNSMFTKINSLPGGEGAVDQALQSGSIAIMVIGLGFAMVGTMHKSMQLVNDVFGA